MYQEIVKYCKSQIEKPLDKSIDTVQKKIIETMAYSKRIKFTKEGNIFGLLQQLRQLLHLQIVRQLRLL